LWNTLQSSTSPSFFSFNSVLPLSFFSSIESSSLSFFLSKALSWWWSSFFHDLFLSGRHLLSPLLLYLPLHIHGWKSLLKDLIEAKKSSLLRSFHQVVIRAQELQVGAPKTSINFQLYLLFTCLMLHVVKMIF